MFKKVKNIIFILLFLSLIIGPIFSWGILNVLNKSNSAIMKTLDFSLNEKRNKATISEPIDLSKITVELDSYFNDRLPFRSVMIYTKRIIDGKLDEIYKNNFEKSMLKLFAKKKEVVAVVQADTIDGKIVKYMDEAVDIYRNHGLRKQEIDPYDDTIEYPIQYLNNQKVLVGQSNWLYLNENNIPYYKGNNRITADSEIKKHIESYVKLNEICKEVGKKLVISICPEKEEIYPEYMPTMEILDEKERPIYIKEYIDKNTDIKYLYPKDELLSLKKNYLLYKKYDSHWNAVGAYIAACRIEEALGLETIPLYGLDLKKEETLDADLAYYGNTSVDTLPPTFKYVFTNYKPFNSFEVTFEKDSLTHDSFTTHCSLGKHKVFLVGDSFREAMMEFFIKDFEEFNCNTFINMSQPFIKDEIKRSDDIVILLVERNEDSVLPSLCNMIYNTLVEYKNEIK